jgi:hypothetical protein
LAFGNPEKLVQLKALDREDAIKEILKKRGLWSKVVQQRETQLQKKKSPEGLQLSYEQYYQKEMEAFVKDREVALTEEEVAKTEKILYVGPEGGRDRAIETNRKKLLEKKALFEITSADLEKLEQEKKRASEKDPEMEVVDVFRYQNYNLEYGRSAPRSSLGFVYRKGNQFGLTANFKKRDASSYAPEIGKKALWLKGLKEKTVNGHRAAFLPPEVLVSDSNVLENQADQTVPIQCNKYVYYYEILRKKFGITEITRSHLDELPQVFLDSPEEGKKLTCVANNHRLIAAQSRGLPIEVEITEYDQGLMNK